MNLVEGANMVWAAAAIALPVLIGLATMIMTIIGTHRIIADHNVREGVGQFRSK